MTLVAMVAAHQTITETLEAVEGSQTVSLSATLKGVFFQEKVKELVKSLSAVKAEILELTEGDAVEKSVQKSTLTSKNAGKNDENQQ